MVLIMSVAYYDLFSPPTKLLYTEFNYKFIKLHDNKSKIVYFLFTMTKNSIYKSNISLSSLKQREVYQNAAKLQKLQRKFKCFICYDFIIQCSFKKRS